MRTLVAIVTDKNSNTRKNNWLEIPISFTCCWNVTAHPLAQKATTTQSNPKWLYHVWQYSTTLSHTVWKWQDDTWRNNGVRKPEACYLAGYILRTCDPAVTCSRFSKKPAVKDPAPTNDSIPKFRLEDRILAKLCAIISTVRDVGMSGGVLVMIRFWNDKTRKKGWLRRRVRAVNAEESKWIQQ